MFNYVLRKIVGTKNQRELKRMQPLVARMNERESWAKSLSDEQMREQVRAWRKEVADTPELQKSAALDRILPDCFTLTREASVRSLGMRHFDVQLIGGVGLHRGMIAEMKTGEGKTLVATLPCVLNALEGKGVHVVTVNDYLAKRDAEWMGRLYRHLGLSVGCVVHGLTDRQRQKEYGADITYGQNNEFGFDYLRDNMKFRLADYVQRELHYAIVDEVDSILIDEARTPLIISGPSEESTDKYYVINKVIPGLIRDRDFTVDEKARSVVLTDEGVEKVEGKLGVPNLYDPEQIETLHHVEQALRAHTLYRKDHEYVVKDGEVIIVDDFTGRLMPGRRWSDGLHQAVEAKENVKIENENQTLATVSFQNYFRLYTKLAGMTGTADTEASEFAQIYKLEVLVIPTNRVNIRKDLQDTVYKTEREKFKAVCDDVEERWKKGQPVLVGTVSIAKSEVLSGLLKKRGVSHDVLNAKQHEREAEIVAQAGRKGRITISTNMAGRGTDILLGGNPEFLAKREVGAEPNPLEIEGRLVQARVEKAKAEGDGKFAPVTAAEVEQVYRAEYAAWKERHDGAVAKYRDQCTKEHDEVVSLGGLHILGTERHESRRIDNQLRGRSGRQGDPGSSRFYLSLEDDLMRIFGGERLMAWMERLGMEEGVPIEHGMVTKSIERAQKQVEGRNFEARKHLLEYDDVMNKQRETVYTLRRSILDGREGKEYIVNAADEIVDYLVEMHYPEDAREHPDEAELNAELYDYFGVELKTAGVDLQTTPRAAVKDMVVEAVNKRYEGKEAQIGSEMMRLHEKYLLLQVIDQQWKDHLLNIDHLKEGIGLRGYGQRDPLVEYKKESFDLFQEMMERVQDRVVKYLWKMDVVVQQEQEQEQRRVQRSLPPPKPKQQPMYFSGGQPEARTVKRQEAKVGRNDPCPCGSG